MLLAALLSFGHASRRGWFGLAILGALAAASFGWTGHGARDEGLAGAVHLAADVLHLLAAAVWIGTLASLATLATQPAAGREVLVGLIRFSGIGVAVVAILVGSGLVNSWLLVGFEGIAQLPTTLYGQLLLAKLGLFGLMLVFAAINRWRLTPRLERAIKTDEGAAALRPALVSLLTETGVALAVLVLVSWLGTLAPPIDS